MIRKSLGLLVALLIASTFFGVTAAHAGQWRWHLCKFQTMDGHQGFSDLEVKRTARCAEEKFPVSAGFATVACIARRESGWNEFAKNPSSSASGVFQVVSGTWSGWHYEFAKKWQQWRVWHNSSVFNARTNVFRSVFVMHRRGLSPWGGSC